MIRIRDFIPYPARIASVLRGVPLLTALAALTATPAHGAPDAGSAARQSLQQRQLQDGLRLQAQQQAAPPRGTLTPYDERRLEQLQLEQRVEQQRLNQEQQLLQQQRRRDPGDRSVETQQRLLDQERQLQLQRFQLQQQELLRSARPRPLQRPIPGSPLQPQAPGSAWRR